MKSFLQYYCLFIFLLFGKYLLAQQTPPKGITKQQMIEYMKQHGLSNQRTPSADNQQLQVGKIVTIKSSPRCTNLSAPFLANTLPSPLLLPVNSTPKNQAILVAKKLIDGGIDAGQALVSAFLQSGIAIKNESGVLIPATQGNQGICIPAFEVLSTGKLLSEGYGLGLETYFNPIKKRILADSTLTETGLFYMREGLLKGLQSTDKGQQFFCNLIIELGKQSDLHYDLIDTANNEFPIKLDALQTILFSLRLVADIYVAENKISASINQPLKTVIAKSGPNVLIQPLNQITSDACTPKDAPAYVPDAAASFRTSLMSKFLDGMADSYDTRLEGMSTKISKANTLLNAIKFFHSYSLLDIKLESVGELKRSRTVNDGEKAPIKITVTISPSALHQIDCYRHALNGFGLDYSIPDQGPVPNVKVIWDMQVAGDYQTLEEADGGRFTSNLLKSIKQTVLDVGAESCRTPFVKIENTNAGNCLSLTDTQGEATVDLTGLGLERNLDANENKPIFRCISIIAYVQIKTTKFTNDDHTNNYGVVDGTITDWAGGFILPLVTGDVAGGVMGGVTEALYRLPWYPTDPKIITLRDWDYCNNFISIDGGKINCITNGGERDIAIKSSNRNRVASVVSGNTILRITGFDQNNNQYTVNLFVKGTGKKIFQWNNPTWKAKCVEKEKHVGIDKSSVSISISKVSLADMSKAQALTPYVETRKDEDGADGRQEVCYGYGSSGIVVIEKWGSIGETISGYYQGTINLTSGNNADQVPRLVKIYGRFSAVRGEGLPLR